ncbi:MAG: GtrA family protein [Synechococcaceae cyanobacterium]
MSSRFLLFCVIGGIAFVVDAGVYLLLGGWLDHPPLQKALGFLGGVSTTYLLNSSFTFRAPLALSRYGLYVVSQGAGMVVNLTAFLVCLRLVPVLAALVLATLAGLSFNFVAARRVLRRSALPARAAPSLPTKG